MNAHTHTHTKLTHTFSHTHFHTHTRTHTPALPISNAHKRRLHTQATRPLSRPLRRRRSPWPCLPRTLPLNPWPRQPRTLPLSPRPGRRRGASSLAAAPGAAEISPRPCRCGGHTRFTQTHTDAHTHTLAHLLCLSHTHSRADPRGVCRDWGDSGRAVR